MKKIVTIISCLVFSLAVCVAQDKKEDLGWKKSAQFGTNFNLTTFNADWKAQQGATGSFGMLTFFDATANLKKAHSTWSNAFNLKYGILKNDGQDSRKNIDVLAFTSKYAFAIQPSKVWSGYVAAGLLSQMTESLDYSQPNLAKLPVKSNFFSPAFVSEEIGLEYKPSKFFFLQISPLAARHTIVNDTNIPLDGKGTRFGVLDGKTVLNEMGAVKLTAGFDKEVVKNGILKWTYSGFTPYSDIARIDNRLDLAFTYKIGKYFNIRYDLIGTNIHNQRAALQTSQAFTFGFMYTM